MQRRSALHLLFLCNSSSVYHIRDSSECIIDCHQTPVLSSKSCCSGASQSCLAQGTPRIISQDQSRQTSLRALSTLRDNDYCIYRTKRKFYIWPPTFCWGAGVSILSKKARAIFFGDSIPVTSCELKNRGNGFLANQNAYTLYPWLDKSFLD